jgi:hypothetical protein
MKKITVIGLLILISLALVAMLISCVSADAEISKMKSPVILIGVFSASYGGGFCITVRDADGMVRSFNSENTISYTIGKSRHVGDTIK